MASPWKADGPRYERVWGGRPWTLDVQAPRAGLIAEADAIGPVLALDGISARGRSDPDALGGASLAGHEVRFDRVEALYVPEGWGSLRVRATWAPRGDDMLDVLVQVQAFTVGDLEAVQVHVASHLGDCEGEAIPVGNQVRAADAPLLTQVDRADGSPSYYLEMIHPDDGTRRESAGGSACYTLFGYDLERGVILRGRLRGVWLDHRPDEAEVARRLDEFLREPLPLGT
jgi:hypothetical protein